MNGLALFAGGAIGELALKHILPDYRTVGYVDNEEYCQAIIRARIRDGILNDAPIFGDIREFNARYASLYAGRVDWLSAGFPCQPFSVAGHQLGEADERNQWPATRDAIGIIRPRFVLLENVPGLLAHEYIRQIFGDLAEMRYDCEWDVIGASDVGAAHARKRIWFLAYPTRFRRRWWGSGSGEGFERIQSSRLVAPARIWECSPSEKARILGMGNGVANTVDRIRCTGQGWVVQVLARILQIDGE